MRAALATTATVAVTLAAATLASPADAATYTSTGVRCTIVGTAGADVLVGTSRRDVICGRGGNDTIRAGGGNDLIDAGRGADQVRGGDGSDRVIGGAGKDRIAGNAGTDALLGGDGGDVINGGSGADGLYGQAGNDDLIGGATDDVLGGNGTNWCLLDASDEARRCVYDETPPKASDLQVTPDRVDVTDGSAEVTVRVHLVDDTGVEHALASLSGAGRLSHWMGLESGTVRDGWWRTTIVVPRLFEPGPMTVGVSNIKDRVNHYGEGVRRFDALQVDDDDPDRELPTVLDLTDPSTGQLVDVRSSDKTVLVRARVADAQSGVSGVTFGLVRPDGTTGDIDLPLVGATRKSGTAADGWWEGRVDIPRNSPSGDWAVSVRVRDRAHAWQEAEWTGPNLYARRTVSGIVMPRPQHPLPDGAGTFVVKGDDSVDASAPQVLDLSYTPDSVDTLPGPAEVTVSIHVVDDVGVRDVWARLFPVDRPSDPAYYSESFTLASGTKRDGIWTSRVVLPQGSPPGDYGFNLHATDGPHSSAYTTSDPMYTTEYGWEPLPGDPRLSNQHALAP